METLENDRTYNLVAKMKVGPNCTTTEDLLNKNVVCPDIRVSGHQRIASKEKPTPKMIQNIPRIRSSLELALLGVPIGWF